MSRRGNGGRRVATSVATTGPMPVRAAERAIVLLARWAGNRAKRVASEREQNPVEPVSVVKLNSYRRRKRQK
jgi:hypothetical protein